MHQFMLCVCCVPTADSASSQRTCLPPDPALPPPTAVIPGTTAGLPAHHYLITPYIYLSPLDNHDTNAIMSHLNNPLITSTLYGVPRPYTWQHAKSWVKDARGATQANRGIPLTYSIRVAATGEHIGVVSLSPWSSARTSFAPTRMPTPFGPRAGTIEEPWSIGAEGGGGGDGEEGVSRARVLWECEEQEGAGEVRI
ncbi:hypothetical protein BC936DRAFT_145838 [Jimgerdemannia flammicorona]|uniref:N-acetyltransferase domain-containing protein n=1 Tax=Jimgerdemannia flammicorona TaxID=994334 RepID=A0A433D935_9FUNG|nr:hypothetical protein BC936DRAFT_145838 [Jimgerdemannia flammicorona]